MQIPGIDQHAYDSVQSHHKNWTYGVGGVSSRLDDQFPLRNTHSCLWSTLRAKLFIYIPSTVTGTIIIG